MKASEGAQKERSKKYEVEKRQERRIQMLMATRSKQQMYMVSTQNRQVPLQRQM